MLLQGFACDTQSGMPFARTSAPPHGAHAHTNAHAHASGLTLASPPASPPQLSPPNTLGNLFNSCRSLQALLASPPPSCAPTLPCTSTSLTPPLAHAPSPMKLRLRSRNTVDNTNTANTTAPSTPTAKRTVKRIVKRQPVRGANKRRRALDDDAGRDADVDVDVDSSADELEHDTETSPCAPQLLAPSPLRRLHDAAPLTITPVPFGLSSSSSSSSPSSPSARPTTPKRARIAPDALPLGLARADFHTLHAGGVPDSSSACRPGTDVEREADGADWSVEDDRMLVELVLEKLRLSREEWQDCARTLGRDRASLGRRWKSLVLHGDVGFKAGRARGKIHGTWR